MHQIDIHNYEAYLLDFSEGNLSDEGQMELELFLIQHPELEINLDELSVMPLQKEVISFADKANLKRTPSDLVSETQFIAYIENQFTKEERLEIEKSCVANPSLSKELELYNNTIVKADESIIFENKKSLKRKPKVIWFSFSAAQYAAAACIIFLIGLFMFWPTKENGTIQTLADKTPTTKPGLLSPAKANKDQQSIENIIVPDESTALTESAHSNTPQQKQLVANNKATLQQENLTTQKKDSINPVNNTPLQSPKNETLIAQNTAPAVTKHSTVVQVISENDDELLASNEPAKKKGIWAAASRALKNLNNVGVKGVDGEEETSKNNTAYALTLGGVSISHKAGKL
jgi:hypothetical protein